MKYAVELGSGVIIQGIHSEFNKNWFRHWKVCKGDSQIDIMVTS
jgi:hypothetical protein